MKCTPAHRQRRSHDGCMQQGEQQDEGTGAEQDQGDAVAEKKRRCHHARRPGGDREDQRAGSPAAGGDALRRGLPRGGGQSHAEDELRGAGDEERTPCPGIEIAPLRHHIGEYPQAEGADGEGDGERDQQEALPAEALQHQPQQRKDQVELDGQTDIPPRRRDGVQQLGRDADAEQAE
ncbi:MAG: hypothetical protein U1E38_03280 [Rhodospirillales bacterium]